MSITLFCLVSCVYIHHKLKSHTDFTEKCQKNVSSQQQSLVLFSILHEGVEFNVICHRESSRFSRNIQNIFSAVMFLITEFSALLLECKVSDYFYERKLPLVKSWLENIFSELYKLVFSQLQ